MLSVNPLLIKKRAIILQQKALLEKYQKKKQAEIEEIINKQQIENLNNLLDIQIIEETKVENVNTNVENADAENAENSEVESESEFEDSD